MQCPCLWEVSGRIERAATAHDSPAPDAAGSGGRGPGARGLTRVWSVPSLPAGMRAPGTGQPSVSEVALYLYPHLRSTFVLYLPIHVRCNHERAGLRDNDLDSCGVERRFHKARYGLPAKDLVKASIYGATSRRLERWRPKIVPLWAALTLHAHHRLLACISRECWKCIVPWRKRR